MPGYSKADDSWTNPPMNRSSPVTGIPSQAIIALSFAAFGSGMSMRVADSMLVRLASDFGVTLGTAAMVITVFALAYGLSQLLFGPLGDRYGKYLVIAWGCIACAFTTALCGVATDFSVLLAARILAGASCAALIPLSMAWIGDVVVYEDRQTVLARFLIGQILGLSTGILLGGISADYFGWRFPFFLISSCFLMTGIWLVKTNAGLPADARRVYHANGHALSRTLSEFRRVLEIDWARKVLGTVLIEGALVYGGLAFVPTHLHTVHDLSLSKSGGLVMLFGLGGFLFALGSRTMVKRLGEVGLVRGGALMMGAAMLIIALTPVWWLAIPACFVFGLGFYMMHNTLQINATQMAPQRRGAAVAAFASCFFIGQSAGVAVGGAFLSSVGSMPLLVAAAIGVAMVGERFARLRAIKIVEGK
jgi:predicted MFS family arabinose efflux permease